MYLTLPLLSGTLLFPVLSFAHNFHDHSISTRHHREHSLVHRQTSPVLPGNWTLQGCYTDNAGARTISGSSFVSKTNMSWEACTTFCDKGSFIYAGVEFAQECFCGNIINNGASNTTSTDCNMACTGSSSEICGGPNRLGLFWNGKVPPPPPITLPSYGSWQSLGCYNDSVNARTLSVRMGVSGPMTVQLCADACLKSGYPLAGVEYATECFCDVKFENFGAPAASGCSMTCAGNSSVFCGGPSRLNVYNYTENIPTPPPVQGGGGGGPPPNGPAPTPVFNGLPGTWNYSGCYVDNAHGRILSTQLPDNRNVTVETCIGLCNSQNFSIAGLEFSVQCFCGKQIVNGGVLALNQASCNMGCGGNSSEACGGGSLLSVYSTSPNITLLPVPVPQNTSLPGSWQYQSCLTDPGTPRVFPYQINLPTNNSAQTCLSLCSEFGYPAAGMEFGKECWCGDVGDIPANTTAPESDCNTACSGDPIHLCGGPRRLQLYKWVGSPLYVWNTPAVTGRYEFLIGGVTVPLQAILGKNNKVSFVEKWGTGPPNSTGAYELDLSLTNRFDLAWREMHVKSDVLCSATLVLPDKAARQINVGGWSLSATYGVRLYIPDGSPGVNGTNDWQENFSELSLQDGRWYPGAMIMPNGSILVMGGEVGSNGPPVPSVEILPKPPGGTVVPLDFLNRTNPNNLYPFLMALPGGGIFVIYYNEARILDEATFATIKTFPIIPGSVTGGGGGRTYPLEGTSVILPQFAPYTDPVVVLVCGGSTPFSGLALDNCVSIAPEIQNPTWTIERMPFKRVITCMTALPDGTFMILNGAQHGTAGFGLGSQPMLTALLYDPSKPINQRMSILNSTIVARMYHSEAILLQDGRVLVSGSDPNPNGGPFPEEYRVEVYIPPYLASGQVQPTYNISQTDWAYGGQYQITNIHLPAGGPARISLLGAVSSTHGNSMGQRTIFPDFSCSGTTCTITAPPNNHVCPPGWFQLFLLDGPTPSWSQWVRIGGDPAQLGNWPNFPDFTLPGV